MAETTSSTSSTSTTAIGPRCGEALPELLAAYGVRHVFGIPGNHTLELYRGLSNSSVTHITTRHEQGAGFMADGYARASGEPGVCFLISGPGLLNAATALGQALADSIPVLVITAVAATTSLGRGLGELHELPDQQAAASSFCRKSVQVNTAQELLTHVADAFALFATSRPGPVHLQIPMDVMVQELPRESLDAAIASAHNAVTPLAATADGTEEQDCVRLMLSALGSAKQPMLLCGGGAVSAAQQWCAIAEALDLPVVVTSNAKGLAPPDHPLAVGGSPSLACTRAALGAADVVLAVGTEFGETDYDLLMDGTLEFTGRLLRIDIDPQQLQRGYSAELVLCASARAAARLFARCLELESVHYDRAARTNVNTPGAHRAQALRAAALKEPHWHPEMAEFFATLTRALGDTCVVGDSTRPTYYATWQYEPARARRYFHSVTGFGTLGYAIPAAFGASVALAEPVVALIGDGGAQFTLTELATAVDNALPVTLLIWSNRGYEEIENSLTEREVDTRSTLISAPDFSKIAAAYGVPYAAPSSFSELFVALQQAGSHQGPSIVEVQQEQLVTQPSGQWYG